MIPFFNNYCNILVKNTTSKNRRLWVSRKSPHIPEEWNSYPSLRGRRLKGKGKGILGAREMRGPGRVRREGGKCVSFPPSSRAPRVSLVPKTPFPFPFKRLPRRLQLSRHLLLNEQKKVVGAPRIQLWICGSSLLWWLSTNRPVVSIVRAQFITISVGYHTIQ